MIDSDNDDDDNDHDDDDNEDQDEEQVHAEQPAQDEEEDIGWKVYHSHKELMLRTERAELKQKQRQKKKGPRKRKPARAWSPKGDYKLEREGIPLLEDPDNMLGEIFERHLFIFKHVPTDPPVRFAQDQRRPLWKGVFQMHPDMGYGADQYYNPKQSQLKVIYASRIKAGQPEDNLVVARDGSTLPYWVDDWQWVKESDRQHKENSKMKKEAERKAAPTAGLPSTREYGALLPLSGWFQTYATNKKKDPRMMSPSGVLRKDPAKALLGSGGSQLISAMRPRKQTREAPAEHEEEKEQPPPVAKRAKKTVTFPDAPKPAAAAAAVPVATSKGLRVLKLQFLAAQMQLGDNGLCKAWFDMGADPDELLTAFVKYAEQHASE